MNPELPPTPRAELEARLTALLLGELSAEDAAALRQTLAEDAALAALHQRLSVTLELVRETAATSAGALSEQPAPLKLSSARREALLAHFKTVKIPELAQQQKRRISWLVPLTAAAAAIVLMLGILTPRLAFRARMARVFANKESWAGGLAGNFDPANPNPNPNPSASTVTMSGSTAPTRDVLSLNVKNLPAKAAKLATKNTPRESGNQKQLLDVEKEWLVPQKAEIYTPAATSDDVTVNFATSGNATNGSTSSAINKPEAFLLAHADSKEIAQELKEVFAKPENPTGTQEGNPFAIFGSGRGGRGGDAGEDNRRAADFANAVSDDQNNAVLINAAPDMMPGISNLITKLDVPQDDKRQIKVLPLHHADPKDVATELSALFPNPNNTQPNQGIAPAQGLSDRQKKEVTVNAVADERTQSVLVTASKDTMPEIEKMVDNLDQNPSRAMNTYVYRPIQGGVTDMQGPLKDLFSSSTSRASTSQPTSALTQRVQVAANNGNSLSTAGFSQQQEARAATPNQTPILGDLPIAGRLFRETDLAVSPPNAPIERQNTAVQNYGVISNSSLPANVTIPGFDIGHLGPLSHEQLVEMQKVQNRTLSESKTLGQVASTSPNASNQHGGGGFGGGGGGAVGAGLGSGTSAGYVPNGQIGPITMTVDPVSGSIIYTTDANNNSNVVKALQGMDKPRPQIYDPATGNLMRSGQPDADGNVAFVDANGDTRFYDRLGSKLEKSLVAVTSPEQLARLQNRQAAENGSVIGGETSDGRALVAPERFGDGGRLLSSRDSTTETGVPTSGFTAGLTPDETAKHWSNAATLRGFYDDNSLTASDGTSQRHSYGIEVSPQTSFNRSVDQTSADGHGTHVAGIIAGSGGSLAETPLVASVPSSPAVLARMQARRDQTPPPASAAPTVEGTSNLGVRDQGVNLVGGTVFNSGTINNGNLGYQAGTSPTITTSGNLATDFGVAPPGQQIAGENSYRNSLDTKSDRQPATNLANSTSIAKYFESISASETARIERESQNATGTSLPIQNATGTSGSFPSERPALRAALRNAADSGEFVPLQMYAPATVTSARDFTNSGTITKLDRGNFNLASTEATKSTSPSGASQTLGFSNLFGLASQGVAPFTSYPGTPGTNGFVSNNRWQENITDRYNDPNGPSITDQFHVFAENTAAPSITNRFIGRYAFQVTNTPSLEPGNNLSHLTQPLAQNTTSPTTGFSWNLSASQPKTPVQVGARVDDANLDDLTLHLISPAGTIVLPPGAAASAGADLDQFNADLSTATNSIYLADNAALPHYHVKQTVTSVNVADGNTITAGQVGPPRNAAVPVAGVYDLYWGDTNSPPPDLVTIAGPISSADYAKLHLRQAVSPRDDRAEMAASKEVEASTRADEEKRSAAARAAEPANISYDWTMPVDQVLDIYSKLVGRTPLHTASGPTPAPSSSTITLKTESPLTHTEAIQDMETILGMNGLTIVPVGDKFFKVVSESTATAAAGTFATPPRTRLSDGPRATTEIVKLKSADPKKMVDALRGLANSTGSVIYNPATGSLVLQDYTETVNRMLAKIKDLDTSAPSTASIPSILSTSQTSSLIIHNSSFPKAATNSPIPQTEIQTRTNAFSTFSLNVSDVSFKLAAASLQKGALPDPAAIRSEEFINAFDYRDLEPAPGAPIGFAWDRAGYPFAHNRDLVRFSVKTAALGRDTGRPLNIVLLLDKSGSMERADRVAIIREALRVLAGQLQPRDTISVVVFARTARLWADGLSGDKAAALADNLDGITPEGGTNLEEAMKLAYETALRHYLANGENRVVILTDGAANLGDVKPEDLQKKAETERTQGIALDCFGIGWEDYNDNLLEVLSRAGGGRYGFINAPEEAATEFAGQLAGALRVAASDVKVQVEFNPARVTSYRQIGYAKDQLTKEQFRDNTVKAAQLGVKESGNALYTVELNPQGDGPICTVHVRYRTPGTSDYYEHAWDVPYTGVASALDQSDPAIRLAATASAFSEWLAGSPYAAEVTPDQLLTYMRGIPELYGPDHRPAELAQMLREAKSISGQ